MVVVVVVAAAVAVAAAVPAAAVAVAVGVAAVVVVVVVPARAAAAAALLLRLCTYIYTNERSPDFRRIFRVGRGAKLVGCRRPKPRRLGRRHREPCFFFCFLAFGRARELRS